MQGAFQRHFRHVWQSEVLQSYVCQMPTECMAALPPPPPPPPLLSNLHYPNSVVLNRSQLRVQMDARGLGEQMRQVASPAHPQLRLGMDPRVLAPALSRKHSTSLMFRSALDCMHSSALFATARVKVSLQALNPFIVLHLLSQNDAYDEWSAPPPPPPFPCASLCRQACLRSHFGL